MPEKAPYKLAVKLTSSRPDALAAAIQNLQAIASEYDSTGEATATITCEGYKEQPLLSIRDAFEMYLYRQEIGIDCEVTAKAPGLRHETVTALRATRRTPMDAVFGMADKYGSKVELKDVQAATVVPTEGEQESEQPAEAETDLPSIHDAQEAPEQEAERAEADGDDLLKPWERLLRDEQRDADGE